MHQLLLKGPVGPGLFLHLGIILPVAARRELCTVIRWSDKAIYGRVERQLSPSIPSSRSWQAQGWISSSEEGLSVRSKGQRSKRKHFTRASEPTHQGGKHHFGAL